MIIEHGRHVLSWIHARRVCNQHSGLEGTLIADDDDTIPHKPSTVMLHSGCISRRATYFTSVITFPWLGNGDGSSGIAGIASGNLLVSDGSDRGVLPEK